MKIVNNPTNSINIDNVIDILTENKKSNYQKNVVAYYDESIKNVYVLSSMCEVGRDFKIYFTTITGVNNICYLSIVDYNLNELIRYNNAFYKTIQTASLHHEIHYFKTISEFAAWLQTLDL